MHQDSKTSDTRLKDEKSESQEIKDIRGELDTIGRKDRIALTVSATALVVAILSAVVSTVASYREGYYKELLIQPGLVLSLDNNKGIFSFKNTGVGAAVIKKISLRDNYGCLSGSSNPNYYNYQTRFLRNLQYDIQKDLHYSLSTKYNRVFKLTQDLKIESIGINGIIAPAEQLKIIEISADFVDKSDVTDNDLMLAKETFFADAFERSINNRSVLIDYCSLSGKTCKFLKIGSNQQHCTGK